MRHRAGWTFIEVLVATAVLALLLLLVTGSLSSAQHAWSGARSAAELTRTSDAAITVLRSCLSQATLRPHPVYDDRSDMLADDSDLHFVCWPVADLLPAVPGACGDAIFFQRVGRLDDLHGALQACGFFVQYGEDATVKPRFVADQPERRRFRLMQFHSSNDDLVRLRQCAAGMSRSEVHQWFTAPLANGANTQTAIVAENVIAMLVESDPIGPNGCYDSRRHQWDGDTPAARLMRHRLPHSMTIWLLQTDEVSWLKLDRTQCDQHAAEIREKVREVTAESRADMRTAAMTLKGFLEARSFACKVSTLVVPLAQ